MNVPLFDPTSTSTSTSSLIASSSDTLEIDSQGAAYQIEENHSLPSSLSTLPHPILGVYFAPGKQFIFHVSASNCIVKVSLDHFHSEVSNHEVLERINFGLQKLLPPLLVHLTTIDQLRLTSFIVNDDNIDYFIKLAPWPFGRSLRYQPPSSDEPVPTWDHKVYIIPRWSNE